MKFLVIVRDKDSNFHIVASIDVMDISGQQQMGIVSRIVKIDLDEKRKPVNVALSSVLAEVFFISLFLSFLESKSRRLWKLLWI